VVWVYGKYEQQSLLILFFKSGFQKSSKGDVKFSMCADSTVAIYSKENIDQLHWQETAWNQQAKKIIPALVKEGPAAYFSNINASMKALVVDGTVLPITVCEPVKKNSYVCSPYCHYVTYGLEHLRTQTNRSARIVLRTLLKMFGRLLRFGQIDKNVIVNNWLLPTNLYPELTKRQLEKITQTLTKSFPDYAILMRSINPMHPKGLYHSLNQLEYRHILSREIYFTNPLEKKAFTSRMFKSDLKLLGNTSYTETADLKKLERSIPRLKELYFQLNVEKYSACNPQYKEAFIRLAMTTQWMTFKAFEKDGLIDAVFGYYSTDQEMTSPFFGYDLSLPAEQGLYRQISAKLLLDAKEQKKLLHQSAGAGHYKKLRRAKAEKEYTAVYMKHLGSKRRACWKLLQEVINRAGKSFMEG